MNRVLLAEMIYDESQHRGRGSQSLHRTKMNTRRRLTCGMLALLTITAVSLQIIGLSLFVFGFFPVKHALSSTSGTESFYSPGCHSSQNDNASALPRQQLKSLYQELSEVPPLYDRLILMVIDGLPAEFVLGKDGNPPRNDLAQAMPYTQSLLDNGAAVGFHAKAAPPTVTMPRLKALVSGAIGGFLDVAFNFNTQAMLDDNVLDQLFKIGWKMVMLGDETWLKLFPRLFMRHDGVSSFFVKDTVQVDQNVSRHLEDELSRNDWNLLILHYLGLDHVGHIGGRNSYLMAPKLKEMDDVIKMIHLNTIKAPENDQGDTLLIVVSDHGMTEIGNHGGSSYEETDSLALFIGLKNDESYNASASDNFVYQVDVAPTIALLFGVPIPKNNVGVLISETFNSLTDKEKLRALELNSWQLLRLVEAQLPGLACGCSCNGATNELVPRSRECSGTKDLMLCCLYLNAAHLHSSWRSKKINGSNNMDDYNNSAGAYHNFLNTASEWLSRRVTDKPVALLAFGIMAMAIACLILLGLIICLGTEQNHSMLSNGMSSWRLEDAFTVGIVLTFVLSMGSSSMVEEEHYIWHFMVSTLYLILLRKTVQCFPERSPQTLLKYFKGRNERTDYQFLTIILLLLSGRILRGWHQGGVNWSHLPDISKWLEQVCGENLTLVQLTSGLLVICLGMFALASLRYFHLIGFCFLVSGSLVIWYIVEYRDSMFVSSSYGATVLAQIIYAFLGATVVGTAVVLPWLMPVWISGTCSKHNSNSQTLDSVSTRDQRTMMESRDFSYIIGLSYAFYWCLLQLLLQQPINSVPIFLLFVQILAIMLYYSHSGPRNKEWVEVASLYYLGMAGHFALGNTNTLATIDVAGAFIGLSSHSTLLSGILMFSITYASPMLFLLSMVMYNSVKPTVSLSTSQNVYLGQLLKARLGFPCLVPLCVNSILLTGYTIVLLLMRNHLFVWSVFSPKYLYVCATTICTYIGVFLVSATEIYTCFILRLREKRQA